MNKPRLYRSALREEQAEATARRIVEAALRVLERGPATFSIPAVAREAGVAVPTVYNHFGDKGGLIRAVGDHLDRSTGLEPPSPESPEDLAAHIRLVAPYINGLHALLAPALRSPEGQQFRREQLADRVLMMRRALAGAASRLAPAEAEHLVAIATVLCTSETLGLLQEYLGLSNEAAADAIAWAVLKLSEEDE
jgi:AcrR family transcriptional regulator